MNETMPWDKLPIESFLRVRIHTVRVTIEQLAADAYSKVTRTPIWQANIVTKLLCLLPSQQTTEWREALRTIRLAQYCYRRTSDVLHGRSSLVGVTSSMVDEWEEMATRLEMLHRTRFPSQTQ